MTAPVLLPPNASPLERALEQSMAHYDAGREVPVDRLWRPFECPAVALPFLAWALGVRRWDPTWPEMVRRQAVANAIAVHRIRGTIGAVKAALTEIGAEFDIEERPGGADFTIAIAIYNSNTLLGQTGVAEIDQYVEDVKRFSVEHSLTLQASLDCSYIDVAAAVAGVQIADFVVEAG